METKQMYYRMGEVSRMLSIPISTIRFWEKNFEQLSPTYVNNQRRYTTDDIEVIKKINYLLRIKRLKIDGAKEQLSNESKSHTKFSALERLEALKLEIDDIIEKLKSEI